MKFFLVRKWRQISPLLVSGLQALAVSTMLLVSVVLLLVVALICSLLMTLTRSRTSRPTLDSLSTPLGVGSKPGRYNV